VHGPLPERYYERFMDRFLAAWPERDLPVEMFRDNLSISAREVEGGSMVHVQFLGSKAWFGPFTPEEIAGAELQESLDFLAASYAEDEESNRWFSRGGWRGWKGT
jgi:hypothetical protein